MIQIRLLSFTSVIVLLFSFVIATAQVPMVINYQGRLTDGAGNPVPDNSYSVQFSVYDAATGGAVKWTETQTVSTSDGLFAVLLGSITPVSDSVFSEPVRYLAIKVGADPELSPRTMLVTVPWAFRVSTVDGSTGGTISSDLNIAGKANIGVGNTNAGTGSFVAGNNCNASGSEAVVGGGNSNVASSSQAVVGGGADNTASGDNSVVTGGSENSVSGLLSSIGGGELNNVSGGWSVVSGGSENSATSYGSTVSGGIGNLASDTSATVGGGRYNFSRGRYSVIAGGGGATFVDSNSAFGDYSVIAGGGGNVTDSSYSTVGGGIANNSLAVGATIAGGSGNNVIGNYSNIAGGFANHAEATSSTVSGGNNNWATANDATVGGGGANHAFAFRATVGGGSSNEATGQNATVGGGGNNRATGEYSTVAGGGINLAGDSSSTVGGGKYNYARGAYSVIAGGGGFTPADSNTASGDYSCVPGGRRNLASGRFSFAAGQQAKAIHDGSFVWSDSNSNAFSSSAINQFSIRATGGTRIFSNLALTAGVLLAAGGSSWSAVSDSSLKRNIREVDYQEVLNKVVDLPISRWSYESQDESIEHIGPMAQDFHRLFNVGEDDKHINTLDPDGIALAAIKALYNQNQMLKDELLEVKRRLERIERTSNIN